MKARQGWKLLVVAAAPLLMAALWMDTQPSYKPYRTPALPEPVGSVPVTGVESSERQTDLRNPTPASPASLAQGKTLFEINCVMCHGATSATRGPVGQKLNPPPPGLDHDLVHGLSDADIFNAMAFGFGRMPTFRTKLAPAERWHLVNYLRTRQ